MQLTIASVAVRSTSKSRPNDGFEPLVEVYLERCSAYAGCHSEAFGTEAVFLNWLGRRQSRTPVFVVLLDSRGKQMTSEAFAAWLGARRDEGLQHLVFAIGPADGWSAAARERGNMLLSLGPMTFAHALARLVIAEQIYRAFTILAGHPYHSGH